MIGVTIGFVSAGLLLLTMGLLIRGGMTWLIAGYDPAEVRDEKGLAKWVGTGLLCLGAVGILCGGMVFLLPEAFAVIPVILFPVASLTGAITILIGIQRFVK